MSSATNHPAVQMTICGLDELNGYPNSGVTHVLSILDPGSDEPAIFNSFQTHARKTVYFHDEIEPGPNVSLPQPEHIETIIALGHSLGRERLDHTAPHVLIHCHMGVSRSSAATAILFAALDPKKSEIEILAHILARRPQAWPNCRMIALADDLLSREGRLTAALCRLYATQLERNPAMGAYLRIHGRGREVDMGLSTQIEPRTLRHS